MASLLDSLLGTHTSTAPRTPQEATHVPPGTRDQTDLAHPLVGDVADPTPPPGQTYDAHLLALAAQIDAATRNVSRVSAMVEVLAELGREQAQRNSDLDTLLEMQTGAAYYAVATQGRPYNRILVSHYHTLTVTPLGQQGYNRELAPGWNTLDVPDGTRLSAATTAFHATMRSSYAPTMTPNGTAVAGYIALASNAPTNTTAATDTAVPFAATVGHWLLQNNTSANVQFELDATASAGSPILAPGATWTSDVPVSSIHLYTAANQNINGTAAGNIVVKGWL